jgi:hypothetical protein
MTKDEALKIAWEALAYINEGANNQGPHTGISWRCAANKSAKALNAIKAALEAKDEPVAWSEDFDAMPFNTYCKAIVDWYSHSRDGDSFLEGRDVEVIVVKYESGKGEYDTVFIHEGNKQYAYTRCEVSKWKPLYLSLIHI